MEINVKRELLEIVQLIGIVCKTVGTVDNPDQRREELEVAFDEVQIILNRLQASES